MILHTGKEMLLQRRERGAGNKQEEVSSNTY